METLTPINILLLILGLSLQVLVTVKNAVKSKDFSILYWIKDNWLEIPISLICSFAGLLMAQDIIELLGVKADSGAALYMVHAFICGYGGREIIFRLIDWFKKK